MTEKRVKEQDKDRMPPENEDMEQGALGSLLLDPALIPGIGLKSDDFYHTRHQLVYEAMLALHGCKDPVNIITITEELTKRGKLEVAGGASYISGLLDVVPSAQSAAHYAGKVRELAVLRKMIDQANRTIRRAYAREDAHEILAELNTFTSSPDHSPTLGALEYFDMEKVLAEGKAYGHGGKDTGYPELNAAFRIMPQELTLITARVGQGKSSLAYNLLLNFLDLYPEETFIYFNLDTSLPIVASRIATIKAARDYEASYSYEVDVLPGYQSADVRLFPVDDPPPEPSRRLPAQAPHRQTHRVDAPPRQFPHRRVVEARQRQVPLLIVVLAMLFPSGPTGRESRMRARRREIAWIQIPGARVAAEHRRETRIRQQRAEQACFGGVNASFQGGGWKGHG